VAGTLGLGGEADSTASTDDLDTWLADTLKKAFDLRQVERDEDGDLFLTCGSSVLFFKQTDPEAPFLTIFAPLLLDFKMSDDVYEAVNSINTQVPMAKATVDADSTQIVLSIDLPLIDTLSPEDLVLAVEVVSEAADHFDTLLQKRFGGSTMLDDDDDEIDV
jgi:hypothetical protein